VAIVDPEDGGGGGLVVGRKYDITCRAWGSRPPASITWYLDNTRLGRHRRVNSALTIPDYVGTIGLSELYHDNAILGRYSRV
jgi:hypothetical protein